MENGRYRRDWEPDRLQIQIDRSLFFDIFYHYSAHTALIIFLPPGLGGVKQRIPFLLGIASTLAAFVPQLHL